MADFKDLIVGETDGKIRYNLVKRDGTVITNDVKLEVCSPILQEGDTWGANEANLVIGKREDGTEYSLAESNVEEHNTSPTAHPGMMRNLGAITDGDLKAKILELGCSGVVDIYPAVTGLPAPGFYQEEIFYCGAGRIHVQLTNLNTPEHRTYKILCVDGGWSDWVSLYDTATITVSDTAPTTVLGNDMIVMVPR